MVTTYAGFTIGVSLAQLLGQSLMEANLGQDFVHLSASGGTGDDVAAFHVNKVIERIQDEVKGVAMQDTDMAVTGGTQTVAIPTGLRASDIAAIRFKNTGLDPAHDGLELTYLEPSAVDRLSPAMRSGYWTEQWPRYWWFDVNRTLVKLGRKPQVSLTLTGTYRLAATAITTANVTAALLFATSGGSSGTDTNISYLPATALEAMIFFLGSKIARPISPARAASLMEQFDTDELMAEQGKNGGMPGALQQLQKRISDVPARWGGERSSESLGGIRDRSNNFSGMGCGRGFGTFGI